MPLATGLATEGFAETSSVDPARREKERRLVVAWNVTPAVKGRAGWRVPATDLAAVPTSGTRVLTWLGLDFTPEVTDRAESAAEVAARFVMGELDGAEALELEAAATAASAEPVGTS
jgi:hypothetical protein